MQKFHKKFEFFIKKCIRQLKTIQNGTPKPRGVDTEAKIVYGGDLPEGVSIANQSFGQVLFNRMMCPSRREETFQVSSLTHHTMTTKNCLQNSVALAERLKEDGIRKGDFILLIGNNSLNMNIALIGIFFLGAVPLPLTHKASLDEFQLIISSIRPKYVGCDKKYVYSFKKALIGSTLHRAPKMFLLNQRRDITDPTIEGFADFIKGRGKNFESFQPAEVSDTKNELALLMKAMTAGRIGRVVGITHHNINSVIARYDAKDDGVELRQLVILMVQKVMWMSGIYSLILSCCYGSKLIVMTKFDEENFMKTINDFKVTITFLYSSKCWQLYKHVPKGVYDLSSCKHFIAIDGSLPKFLMDGLRNKIGVIPRPSYGITEFTGLVLEPSGGWKEGSTGKLVPQVYGKVISDKTYKNAGPNERGELCFKGPSLTNGFINDERSNKSLVDKEGFLYSGHYGYYDEDGDFFIIDKIIHQIKYRDFKVSPKELEGIVKSLVAVKDVCVAGIPHPTDGEHPVAFVSVEKGYQITEKDVIDYVKGIVPEYKQLRLVVFVSKVPRFRDSGGIKRNLFKKIISKYRVKLHDNMENPIGFPKTTAK